MPTPIQNRFPPFEADIVSIQSSNDTADNLPGPGRLLGKVYNEVGKRLESLLNSIAEKRRLGPSNIAQRIKDRERPVWPFPPTDLTGKDADRQRVVGDGTADKQNKIGPEKILEAQAVKRKGTATVEVTESAMGDQTRSRPTRPAARNAASSKA